MKPRALLVVVGHPDLDPPLELGRIDDMGRFQFSIRFLLLATVGVAAGTAAVRAEPSWQTALTMDCLTAFFATSAIIGLTRTRGKLRAFWIGTALILVIAAIIASDSAWHCLPYIADQDTNSNLLGWFVLQHNIWPFWCAALLNGLFATFLHWLFAPRNTTGP